MRLLRGVAWVLVVLALIGAGHQAYENHAVPKRYPLPGRMVDVGGFKLRIACEGSASPTVVIDGGIGTATMGWTVVQDEVAKFARVCVYDRAGYFASDDGPGPRTSERLARELHTLLANAGERGPFVLVGHSFGAFTVRVYHQMYPAEVAGVVMVDGSQEDGTAVLKSLLPRYRVHMLEAEQRLVLGAAPLAARIGLLRYTTKPSGSPSDWKLFPAGMKDQAEAWMWRTSFDDIEKKEFARFDESAEQARRSGTLGDLPLVVITARKPWLGPPVTAEDIPAVLKFQEIWINDLQMRLVHLSMRGKQRIAEQSDHGIQMKQPDVVVAAIGDVIGQTLPKMGPGGHNSLVAQLHEASAPKASSYKHDEADTGQGTGPNRWKDCYSGSIYSVGGGVSAPIPIYTPEPEYLDEARRIKEQDVNVDAVVGPDGLVKCVSVVRDPGMGLGKQALKAVRTYRFKPAMKDGKPVAVSVVIDVTFPVY